MSATTKQQTTTLRAGQAQARALGFTLKHSDGEYRVCPKGGKEDEAYYTDALDDALTTMGRMAQEVREATRMTEQVQEQRATLRRDLAHHEREVMRMQLLLAAAYMELPFPFTASEEALRTKLSRVSMLSRPLPSAFRCGAWTEQEPDEATDELLDAVRELRQQHTRHTPASAEAALYELLVATEATLDDYRAALVRYMES